MMFQKALNKMDNRSDSMEQQRRVDSRVIIGVAGLLLTVLSFSVGIGVQLLGDRMRVEAAAVESAAAVQAIQRDMSEMKDAIKVLAKNSTDLLVLTERVNAHDREVEQIRRRVDRLEQQQ